MITPVLNGEVFIQESWNSLQRQTLESWEWLVVDNGSSDDSLPKLQEIASLDARVHVFQQPERGAGQARNLALDHARGDQICFLDIDDELPLNSLSSRCAHLDNHVSVDVVDGRVDVMDATMDHCERIWKPDFRGDAFPELIHLNPQVFFGLTWMIRSSCVGEKRFSPQLTHCEDLHFFLSLGSVNYDFVDTEVLRYRTGLSSAMSDLHGLEDGYRKLNSWVQDSQDIDRELSDVFRLKVRRIVFRSWLKAGKPWSALKSAFRSW